MTCPLCHAIVVLKKWPLDNNNNHWWNVWSFWQFLCERPSSMLIKAAGLDSLRTCDRWMYIILKESAALGGREGGFARRYKHKVTGFTRARKRARSVLKEGPWGRVRSLTSLLGGCIIMYTHTNVSFALVFVMLSSGSSCCLKAHWPIHTKNTKYLAGQPAAGYWRPEQGRGSGRIRRSQTE